MNKRAVRCENLVKEFGEGSARTRVLHGVDLEIELGKITMLVGPSGCGKTTLISLIAGLLEKTAGTMEVMGNNLESLSSNQQAAFRRQQMGFIFQQYNLLPSLTAAENAAVPLLASGVPLDRAVVAAEKVLEQLEMGHKKDAYPRQLSGGQQQRVAIARALVHQPSLLLCDEPTAALDAHTGHAVMEMLKKAAFAPNRAVVIVTHDNRIFPFAHTIAHMEDGQITHIENPSETL